MADKYDKYKKMTMKELKKLAKSVGFNPVYTDGTPLDKDTLADSIHQFDVAGMFDKKNKGGLTKSRTGPQDFRKGGMVLSTVDNRKNK